MFRGLDLFDFLTTHLSIKNSYFQSSSLYRNRSMLGSAYARIYETWAREVHLWFTRVLRICLLMQGTWIGSSPPWSNKACVPQLLNPHPRAYALYQKPPKREACIPQLRAACLIQLEKALTATKAQHNQTVKINLKNRMSLGVTSYLYLMGMKVSGQSLQESREKVLKIYK